MIRQAAWLGVIGLVLLAVRLIVPAQVSFTDSNGNTVSLGEAHALCASGLGTLAQAMSARVASDCGSVAAGYDLLNVGVVAGVVLLGAAAGLVVAAWWRKQSGPPGGLAGR